MLHIGNPELVEKKLATFTPDNTRIVTDFDATMIQPGDNSWSVFGHRLCDTYRARSSHLWNRFSPFEQRIDMFLFLRTRIMELWWRRHLNLFRDVGLTREHIDDHLIHTIRPRDGFLPFLREIDDTDIPIVVFSAGVSQVIHLILLRDFPGIPAEIIANTLDFCPEGRNIGVAHPPIHVINKTVGHQGHLFPDKVRERTHTLLFGDSLTDLDMIPPDLQDPLSRVTVGFLHQNRIAQKPLFHKGFDIIVESDECDGGVGKFLLERMGIKKHS